MVLNWSYGLLWCNKCSFQGNLPLTIYSMLKELCYYVQPTYGIYDFIFKCDSSLKEDEIIFDLRHKGITKHSLNLMELSSYATNGLVNGSKLAHILITVDHKVKLLDNLIGCGADFSCEVNGDYDYLAGLYFNDLIEVNELVTSINNLSGVCRTVTMLPFNLSKF